MPSGVVPGFVAAGFYPTAGLRESGEAEALGECERNGHTAWPEFARLGVWRECLGERGSGRGGGRVG
jgi:hypothetical protein